MVLKNSGERRTVEVNGLPLKSMVHRSGSNASIPPLVCFSTGMLVPRPIVYMKAEV